MKNLPLKYSPTLATSLVFLLLLGAALYLFQGRNHPDLRIMHIEALLPEYQTHISNFTISYVLFAGIGYLWLMLGIDLRMVLALGGVVLMANWIYELFIPVLNVPDTVDALYGTAGTLTGLALLLLIKRFGIRPTGKKG